MKINIDEQKKILLDSDVVRHFISGNKLQLLVEIFGPRLVFLDIVKDELMRSRHLQTVVSNFIKYNSISVNSFPTDNMDILKEFSILKRRFGDGESACMAVARYKDEIIASSNLRDIKTYCEEHSITYLTTMDILVELIENSYISEKEADIFIADVKNADSKLPVWTMKEYYLIMKYQR